MRAKQTMTAPLLPQTRTRLTRDRPRHGKKRNEGVRGGREEERREKREEVVREQRKRTRREESREREKKERTETVRESIRHFLKRGSNT
jgi:hypothetical protein